MNGCTKIKVVRFAYPNKLKKKEIIEVEEFAHDEAVEFIKNQLQNLKEIAINCPLKEIKFSKNIPFVYGKVISSYGQRGRYIDESGWVAI
jgi:hypothetical protein